MIGRNEAFWEPVYEKLQELFPEELGKISREIFVKAVNKVQPGLIRTEADELTYSLHVLVRYELEKMLIEESLDVEELPKLWQINMRSIWGCGQKIRQKGYCRIFTGLRGLSDIFPLMHWEALLQPRCFSL